jgi:flagellar basal body rod protein FlgC
MQITGIAAAAIEQQTKRLEASAARVASIGTEPKEGEKPVDIAEEAVVRIDASAATTANLAVIKSEDERMKSILDIIA